MRNWSESLPSFEGSYSGDQYGLSRRTRDYFREKLNRVLRVEYNSKTKDCGLVNEGDDLTYDKNKAYNKALYRDYVNSEQAVRNILDMALPNYDPKNSGQIHLWVDAKGRNQERSGRVMMKVGRALKKLFPVLTLTEVENLVDEYRRDFAPRNLSIFHAKDAASFKKAYLEDNYARMENPSTTCSRKSIANSCMRHRFERLPNHPAEAFSSGDFQISWTENEDGQVCSRVVIRVDSSIPQAGPIYGTSEASMDKLQEYLDEIEAKDCDNARWEGAKLKKINHGGGYVAPYLDIYPKRLDDKDDEYLVIAERGNVCASDYSGLLNAPNMVTCHHCDELTDEDEVSHIHDEPYCNDCYSEVGFCCASCDDYELVDESVTVYGRSRHGHRYSELYCTDCASNCSTVTINDENWDNDHVVETNTGDYISLEDLEEGDWFTSYWDGLTYSSEYRAELEDDEVVSTIEIEAHSETWEQNQITGIWHIVAEEEQLTLELESEC
jgi:hypothetical protein